MVGFVIWALVGAVIIGIGIRDLFAKKPVGFWANVETIIAMAIYSIGIVKKYSGDKK